MKKIIPLVTATLLISACATPTPPPATEEEIASAKLDYMVCLMPYAQKYDDGYSDARTIATALVGACRDEYATFIDTTCRDCNDRVKRKLRDRRSEYQADIATQVVLRLRAMANEDRKAPRPGT